MERGGCFTLLFFYPAFALFLFRNSGFLDRFAGGFHLGAKMTVA